MKVNIENTGAFQKTLFGKEVEIFSLVLDLEFDVSMWHSGARSQLGLQVQSWGEKPGLELEI